MSDIIKGIQIQIGSEELKKILSNLVTRHESKMRAYEDNAKNLLELAPDEEQVGKMSNSPVATLSRSADEHRKKATYFKFLLEHVVDGATYQLTQDDLNKLEIGSRYF